MPNRKVEPGRAWPDLCETGQERRYACEGAQDYLEKARGKNRAHARQLKQLAELQLDYHFFVCEECQQALADRRAQVERRRRAQQRVRPQRRPVLHHAAVRHPVIRRALRVLDGTVVQ